MQLAEQRHQRILTQLSRAGSLRTSELALALDISEMTIRRDLLELEAKNLLQRVHGGAVLQLSPQDEYVSRNTEFAPEKAAIAEKVVERLLILQNEDKAMRVIYLDAGTTAMEVARAICAENALKPMTIVTHAINIAAFLAGQSCHRLHVIGGEIYQNTFSSFGNQAMKSIHLLHFDLFIMGASGFNETSFMNTNYVEISVKHAVLEKSAQVWMMVNSAKWQSNFAVICAYEAIHKLFIGPVAHPLQKEISKQFPHLEMVLCAAEKEL